MKILIVRLLGLTALIALVAAGCEDRGINRPDRPIIEGGVLKQDPGHDFTRELLLQIGRIASRSPEVRVPLQWKMYVPEVPPISGVPSRSYPLLVLLPPQDGDVHYFFNHSLKELASELIADGTIMPMCILTIANDPVFGGYFYAGRSTPAGYYDDLIGGALLEMIYDREFGGGFVDRALPLGIGGVGMGGYGAYRAALVNKDLFGSVSSTDGPLDFDGRAGFPGFQDLFDDVLMEQGLLGGTTEPPRIDTTWECTLWDVDPVTHDSTCLDSIISLVDTIWPPSWRDEFDTSAAWPLTRLFIGAALAFSPNDTFVDTVGVRQCFGNICRFPEQLPDSIRFRLADTLTLITNVVKQDEYDFEFHLPFDSTGEIYQLIWDMWLRNNLENILSDSGEAQLNGVRMWVGTTPQSGFGRYRNQTTSWIETLQNSSLSGQLEVYEYTGYPGNPAADDRYIYDVLREMLIFHSKAFESEMP